jgi:hypothetical protein
VVHHVFVEHADGLACKDRMTIDDNYYIYISSYAYIRFPLRTINLFVYV